MRRYKRPMQHGLDGQKTATLCGILLADARGLSTVDGYSDGARQLNRIECKACKRTKEYKQLRAVYEASIAQDTEARRVEQGRLSPEDLEAAVIKALPWVKYLKTRRMEGPYTSEVYFSPAMRVVCRGAEAREGEAGAAVRAPTFKITWVGFYTGVLISSDFDKLPALRHPLTSESLDACCEQLMSWLRAHYTQGEYRAYSALMGMLNVGG